MTEEFGISWPTVLAQTINLVFVVLIFIAIPLMVWRSVKKWNERRDKQIESIRDDLHEIKVTLENEERER